MENRVFQFAIDKEGRTEVHKGIEDAFSKFKESDVQTRISDEFSMWFREERTSPSSVASTPVEMSIPLAAASIPPRMSTPLVAASSPPATLTQFLQLPYSSTVSTSTPLASSATGLSSRFAPSSSTRPLAPAAASAPSSAPSSQGVVDSHILILPTADAHFVEEHLSFGKVPDRMKNMLYTEFRAHKKRREMAQQNRLWGVAARGPASTPAGLAGEDARGLRTVRTVCPIASVEETVGRYRIRQVLGESAAVTAERQGGSSSSSLVPLIHSAAAHKAYIERERRLCGYMQQAQEKFAGFMTSFAYQCRVQLDLIPTLFLPFLLPNADTTSQLPIDPPALAHLHFHLWELYVLSLELVIYALLMFICLTCLSFHDSLRNQLLARDAKVEQSCFDLKCWHDILDIISFVVDSFSSWTPMWGMIPNFLDSFVGKFLVKKVEGYLCSLIEDLLDKSIRRIVETYSYKISSFETFVIALKGIGPFENNFLNVNVQLGDPCDDHKFLIGLEVLKAFLIEKIFLVFNSIICISRSLYFC
ncbi:hypothetical protein M9H77_08475 [Catharanthus roseus]|uniref:Uncharacterized protein n=1 Tax=Catharanthus roseus TaxID=4058 RepID=A0ACC0BXZ8_CATRO|nr:hypothetical protein M9H77_08475 [Catharanthus roseus]